MTAAAGVRAALAKKAGKYAKADVGFEHPARGPHHCSECEHFEPPHSCEVTAGKIDAGDWCELWYHRV